MKRKFKNGDSPMKTSWLGVCERPRFFTIVTLKALTLFILLSALSLLRSAVVLIVLGFLVAVVYTFFLPDKLTEFQTHAASVGPSEYFALTIMGLIWHGMVCDVFDLFRKWKKKRSRNEIKLG